MQITNWLMYVFDYPPIHVYEIPNVDCTCNGTRGTVGHVPIRDVIKHNSIEFNELFHY